MVISQAKLEANRRNAQRSIGPRTEKGKQCSSLNPVTHGLRAETLVLLDEDPQVLEDRTAAWRACLLPRDEVELSVVDDAVEYAWVQDLARRAHAARLAANIANAGIDEAIREADQVLRLGQKLFVDKRGPVADYPHTQVGNYTVQRVSESELVEDTEDPPRLVLHLQATAGGSQWMLDRWSELRSILEEGLNWQSADKLKVVRLLGRQPIEAVDDRNVLTIFLACQTMEGVFTKIIPELWKELRDSEKTAYAERLRGRGIDRLAPRDAAAARQVLFDVVDRETAQINVKAEAHRHRAEIVDALTADCLLFDDSPEGERLWRYELATGRAKARSLNELRIRQRSPLSVVDGDPLSVVSSPLSVVGCKAEAMAEAIAPNEPTETSEKWGVDSGQTEIPTIGPTGSYENSPNEATDRWENAPNDPTAGPSSVVRCPLYVAGFGLQG
jgi:hypothetical protein